MKNGKLKELKMAFLYVPELFRLVYRTDKMYLFLMIGETLSFAAAPYPTMFLSKYALDAMEAKTSFAAFALVCMGFLLTQLIVNLLRSFFNSRRPGRTQLVQGKLYNAFHRKCMELDYEMLAEKEIQELQSFAGEFIGYQILSGTVWKFVSLFSSLLAFFAACALLTAISPLLILAAIVGLLFDSGINALLASRRFALTKRMSERGRRLSYYHTLSLDENAGKDVRIFEMGKPVLARIKKLTGESLRDGKKKGRLELLRQTVGLLSNEGVNFIIYSVLGWYALKGELSIGSLTLAIGNLALFRRYFGSILDTLVGYTETAKHIAYYARFMNLQSKFRTGAALPLGIQKGDGFLIEFRDVSFRYPGKSEYALQNFNFLLRSGEKLSVVGENGAGKSTFIKLLMRLYDPTEGEILLNGINIKNFDYDEYLAFFAPVFQDYRLFAFTVRENISAFQDSAPEKVEVAAGKAGIATQIRSLPKKYGTYVTKRFDEDGVSFSGGEEQKLAIARAYFKDRAGITVLDEPTSALDPRAEAALYRQFNDLIGDNTAIFISHRLASAKFCDRILVIQNRTAAECGTHEELMQKGGLYSTLYSLQADYYQM